MHLKTPSYDGRNFIEPDDKEYLRQMLADFFKTAPSFAELNAFMKRNGIRSYVSQSTKGSTKGVIFEGKKYRLVKLDLLEPWDECARGTGTRLVSQA